MSILARILKDRGIVSEKQLQEAIQHQVLYGGRLGTSLYELGMVTEERLQDALARAHGLAPGSPDYQRIDPAALALVPRSLAARHKVCPYALKGKTLFLLMVDPGNHTTLAQVGFSLGYIVKPMVVPEFRMIQLLRDHYGVDERWRFTDTHLAKSPPLAPLSEEEASARLDAALTRDEVVSAVLGASHRLFRRVIFFIVREPSVLGWSGAGEGIDAALIARLCIPLDQPSVFQSVTRDKTLFVGRLGPEPQNQQFLQLIGKRPTTNAVLLPIAVKGRVVNLVFGDGGATANVKASLGGLLVVVQKAPRAYLRIIRGRIEEARRSTRPLAGNGGKKPS
jgi:hypothetical protein